MAQDSLAADIETAQAAIDGAPPARAVFDEVVHRNGW